MEIIEKPRKKATPPTSYWKASRISGITPASIEITYTYIVKMSPEKGILMSKINYQFPLIFINKVDKMNK